MSASARTARLRDKVLSRGFKVQNTNHTLSTSNMRGVVPCKTNFDQIIYTTPKCRILKITCDNIVVINNEDIYDHCTIFTEDISEEIIVCEPEIIEEEIIQYMPPEFVIRLNIDGGILTNNEYRIKIIGGDPYSHGVIICSGGGP